jgi:hypothetical protein
MWGVTLVLFLVGCGVAGSIAFDALRGEWRMPLTAALYFGAVCATPFQGQFLRYLMPLAPLFFLAILSRMRARAGTWTAALVILFAAKIAVAAEVFTVEHQRVAYTDVQGRQIDNRLFFYDAASREFDETIDFIERAAAPHDVVAAGTPHWIYLRTGLKAVMPPYEADVHEAQRLLDTVPVAWLVVGSDVIGSDRYTVPVVNTFGDLWQKAYSSPAGRWSVYRRSPAGRSRAAPDAQRRYRSDATRNPSPSS